MLFIQWIRKDSNMTKRFLFLGACLFWVCASSAKSDLIGSWSSAISGDYTVYTLTVTATAGETMYGWDAVVTNTAYDATSSATKTKTKFYTASTDDQDYPSSYSTVDANTHALFDVTSADGKTDYMEPKALLVTSSVLKASESVAGTGPYAGGYSTVALLQCAVLTSSGITSDSFYIDNIEHDRYPDWAGHIIAAVDTVGGSSRVDEVVTIVPEPGTLAMLAGGLLGLFVYAWRRRRV
jgi:hypothetical protein